MVHKRLTRPALLLCLLALVEYPYLVKVLPEMPEMPETPETLDREQVIRGEAVEVAVEVPMQGFKLAAVAALIEINNKTVVMAVGAEARLDLLPELRVLALTPAAH